MMRQISRRYKRYVDVRCEAGDDGRPLPVDILWSDGLTYHVDEVLDVRYAHSPQVMGAGLRHTVRIGEIVTYLFLEDGRWFVEAKEVPL